MKHWRVIFRVNNGNRLEEGINVVGQEILGFELGEGDKVMILSGLTPLCKELVIE